MPQKWFNVSTEYAELVVKTSAHLALRYKALNHDFDFWTDTKSELFTYKWTTGSMKAIDSEPYLPHYLEYMPVVLLSPDDISYEGTTGSFDTWNDYGKWVYGLIENRDRLSVETEIKMQQLTDTIEDDRDKVKAVYEYMQSKTRYVNIALGIGGFQPLHAYEVDEKGYGDCKALSNYTRALLKSIGITSFYAEIGSGLNREIKYPDFASVNQTNHVILCVPMNQDTTWLECTSQTIPFGYIGTSNSDRYALLISEDGGKLAKTPVYPTTENRRVTISTIKINESGNAHYKVNADFINTEYEDVSGLLQVSQKEQRESLLKKLSFEGFVMENFNTSNTTLDRPAASISVEGNVPRFATKSGKRLFFRPEYLFSQTSFHSISKKRELNLQRSVGYRHIDTVTISIPERFQVEHLPENISHESVAGSYSLYLTQTERGIQMIRDLKISSGVYHKSQFLDINAFFEAITRSDHSRIILSQ